MDLSAPLSGIIESLSVVRAILGFIIVFFMPGFAWTFILFKKLNAIERIALSFGLSISGVTLVILALNILLKISVTGLNALIIIIIITVIPIATLYIRKLITKRAPANAGE